MRTIYIERDNNNWFIPLSVSIRRKMATTSHLKLPTFGMDENWKNKSV